MSAAVSHLPQGGGDNTSGAGADPDLYQIAVEEYRFQTKFNWDRTQAVIVFDTSILVAATGSVTLVAVASTSTAPR